MPLITMIKQLVLTALFCIVFTACLNADQNPAFSSTVNGPGKTVAPRPPHSDSSVKPELKRVSESGGEVLIDGSLRVYEPIYEKISDFVEISTSVKPAANHVRIYAIANGTYTVIKAQFDDGQEKVLTNN